MTTNYSHVVSIEDHDEKTIIKIHRLIDGRMDLYTTIDLDYSGSGVDWDAFDKFSALLGKSIFIDSPKIRRRLGIEAEAEKYEASNSADTE